jgi:hypothetical protein
VELADRLAPVEEHFLKNRHQAVLDAGQSENLHADVVHHLRLPKMPLLLAQPHRRVRLFPKNSLPHHHFHQLFERGPFSRVRSEAFAEQLHSS